ncbi:acyl carrier protein [Kutzneria sp. CA-103260]|uniref:acyl carrier protein n=1 Tax=Kutzneria sp. CA-103260 TaxID=2802641 RepID=UPI001BAD7C5A|nr:acyl carrier protein [Kutzneria sp. CA-103260]QUQ68834.1 Phosphopantetheine attachment site [Kutzneria sp. CA-103260]
MSENSLHHVLAAAAAVFGRPVAAEDSFFGVGGDSVTAVELAVELEQRLGGDIDGELVVDSASFGALAAALTTRVASR